MSAEQALAEQPIAVEPAPAGNFLLNAKRIGAAGLASMAFMAGSPEVAPLAFADESAPQPGLTADPNPPTVAAENPIATSSSTSTKRHLFNCNQHYYDRRGRFHALEGQHFTRYRVLEVKFDGVPSYDKVRYNICLPAHRYKVEKGHPRVLLNPTVGDCRRGVTTFPHHWILTCGKKVTSTMLQKSPEA